MADITGADGDNWVMLVAGIWVALLGTGLIIVASVVLAIRWQSLLLIRRLRGAPRLTCADLTAVGRLPRRVLVSGMTAPGPAGTLTSPGFRVPCLWYRFAVRQDIPGESASGDPFRDASASLARGNKGGPVAVADGTGSVLLDLDLAINHVSGRGIIAELLDEAALSRSHRAEASSPLDNLDRAGLLPGRAHGLVLRKSLTLQEQFIPADRPVTVLGRPRRRGGQVIVGRRGVLSAADPETWVATLAADTRSSAALLRFFPIGAVVGAVGVVLIVIGVQ
jgi:hypothetical protein